MAFSTSLSPPAVGLVKSPSMDVSIARAPTASPKREGELALHIASPFNAEHPQFVKQVTSKIPVHKSHLTKGSAYPFSILHPIMTSSKPIKPVVLIASARSSEKETKELAAKKEAPIKTVDPVELIEARIAALANRISKRSCTVHFVNVMLNSDKSLKIPKELLRVTQSFALLETIKAMQEFRKHLLSKTPEYDALLKQVIIEQLDALEIAREPDIHKSAQRIYKIICQLPINCPLENGSVSNCFMMLGGYNSDAENNFRGHSVVYVFVRTGVNSFDFRVINTGESAPDVGVNGKTRDLLFQKLTLDELDISFITMLLAYQNEQETCDNMDVLYGEIDERLSKNGVEFILDRDYTLQGKGKNSCSSKCISSYNKFRLNYPKCKLALEFKAFYSELMVQKFNRYKLKVLAFPEADVLFSTSVSKDQRVDFLNSLERRGLEILEKRRRKAGLESGGKGVSSITDAARMASIAMEKEVKESRSEAV